jgi:hypothetical protein
MAAVSLNVPNLLGGISQQPDPIKIPGQVRNAVNAYLDPTFGCKKRPPIQFISRLATNIPSTAKWFPIFRDEDEKYVVCIYLNGTAPVVRVWDAVTGSEKTVTMDASATEYLRSANVTGIKNLSLADYTLLCNQDRVVTMSENQDDSVKKEALVIINALSYNTVYSIDLNRDGNTTPTKVYRATGLEVIPGSYTENDGGLCTANSAQDHTVSSGAKTGLIFRIVNQCAAFLDSATNTYRSRYTTSVILKNGGSGWRVGDTVNVTQSGKTFTVRVTSETFVYTFASDGTATYTTASSSTTGTLSIADIVTNLVSAVNAISGYSGSYVGNVIRIRRTDTRDFNVAVRGGSTDRAMTVLKGTANDVSQLPGQCFDGYILKVNNSERSDSDDYYVKFIPDSEGIPGTGYWEETVKPGIATEFNSSTMPHALIRLSNGDFELKALNSSSAFGGWAPRQVGDLTTNPAPSFVGRTISEMFFFNNRLGFLTEDAVVLSQPGDYFNFFVNSAITISDADPIDLTAASTRPALLKAAIGTPKGLILFAENAQFMLASSEIQFSPSTVKMSEISNYNYRSIARPVNSGISVMFVSESESYSKIMEMAVDSAENRPQVAEITRIIPELIPPDLVWSAVSPNNNFAAWGTGNNTVYNFKFYNSGNERQIAGWTKWVMPTNVRLFQFDNDTCYVVTYDGTSHVLGKIQLIDDPDTAPITSGVNKFVPRLDFYSYKSAVTMVTSGSQKKVYFPAGSYVAGAQPVFIVTDGTSVSTFTRPAIQTDGGGSYILVDTDLTTANFIIGLEYQLLLELPAFYVAKDNRADRVYSPIVEFLNLDLYYSGRYTVTLNKVGYDSYSEEVDVTSAGFYEANTVPLEEVETRTIPVFSKGSDVTVTITADDPVPAALTSYSWQGHYNRRGIASLN